MEKPSSEENAVTAEFGPDKNRNTSRKQTDSGDEPSTLWMERILTVEGYRQLRSKNWKLPGAFLLILGLLSDYAQLATTYFDASAVANPYLIDLPFWALSGAALAALAFIIAVASRSRFCAACAGYLPHIVFAAMVFGGVFLLQKAVLAEEVSPETGDITFIDRQGNETTTNSMIGYVLGLNVMIDSIQRDITEIKGATSETNQRTERIETKLDEQKERIETLINSSTNRDLIELLAVRFGHKNPDAPTDELISYLKEKSTEFNALIREQRPEGRVLRGEAAEGDLSKEYLESILQEKVVILLKGNNSLQEPIYSYLQITIEKLQELRPKLVSGESFTIADFGTVLAAGKGEPDQKLREEMREKYGMQEN